MQKKTKAKTKQTKQQAIFPEGLQLSPSGAFHPAALALKKPLKELGEEKGSHRGALAPSRDWAWAGWQRDGRTWVPGCHTPGWVDGAHSKAGRALAQVLGELLCLLCGQRLGGSPACGVS